MATMIQADTTVHVVDDDAALRDSLAFLISTNDLEPRLYASPLELLEAARREPLSGCILTDVRMPEMSGIDLARRLRASGATTPIVVMTGHADLALAVEAMRAGVQDFIEKPFDDAVLIEALQRALAEPDGARTAARDPLVAERLASLSQRELEVLEGLVAGHANKVIAYDLGISPRTVEVYRAIVMTKMQVRSLSELVRVTVLTRGG